MKNKTIGQNGQFAVKIKGEIVQLMELESFCRKMGLSRYKAMAALKKEGEFVRVRRGKRFINLAIVSVGTKCTAEEVAKELTGRFQVEVMKGEWQTAMFAYHYAKQETITKSAIVRRADSPRFNVEIGTVARFGTSYNPLMIVLRRKKMQYASTNS